MSRTRKFRPTTFGQDAINTINGTCEVNADTILDTLFLRGQGASPSIELLSITTPLINLNAALVVGQWSVHLPLITTVPLGLTVTFKRDESANRIVIVGNEAQIDDYPLLSGMRFYNAWQSVTLYNNGTRWLIVEYFNGTI